MAAYLARIFQHFHNPSAQPVAHKCHRQHSLKYRRLPGCSSLPFAGKIYWSHLSCPVSQQGSLGYKQRGLSKELLSIQPDQGCQQGSIRGKMFPLARSQKPGMDTAHLILLLQGEISSQPRPSSGKVSATLQGFSFILSYPVT